MISLLHGHAPDVLATLEAESAARIEAVLRDGSARGIATEERVLTWTGIEWLVCEYMHRGKHRGTWRPVHRGSDFAAARALLHP